MKGYGVDYQINQDEDFGLGHFSNASMFGLAGTVGVASALGAYLKYKDDGGGITKKIENFIPDNYKSFTGTLFDYDIFDKKTGKSRIRRNIIPYYEEVRQWYPWRKREINTFDKWWSKTKINPGYKRAAKKLKRGYVLKAPIEPLVAISLMDSEMTQRGNLSGLATGFSQEVLGSLGGRLGSSLGTVTGNVVGSGIFGLEGGALGAVTGASAFVGAFAGAVALSSIVGAVEKMSDIGIRWSDAQLSGNFLDSSRAQTMRGRSLEAIRTSMFNIRSDLGNEAMRLAGL